MILSPSSYSVFFSFSSLFWFSILCFHSSAWHGIRALHNFVKLLSSMVSILPFPSASINNGSNQSIDPSSPLFLNNGENLTLNLVGINFQRLTTTHAVNPCLFLWVLRISYALLMDQCQNHLLMTISSKPRLKAMIWWFLGSFISVLKDIASTIIYIKSSQDIWNELRESYSQSNGPRVFQLQKALATITQDNSFISQYYTRLKILWVELNNYKPMSVCNCCNCGRVKIVLELHNQEKVYWFLMCLSDSFSSVKAQVLRTDPLLTLHKVFSLIIQEERQQEITVSSSLSHESSILMTNFVPTSAFPPTMNHTPITFFDQIYTRK